MTLRESVYPDVLEPIEHSVLYPVDSSLNFCAKDYPYQRTYRSVLSPVSIASYYPYSFHICSFIGNIIKSYDT